MCSGPKVDTSVQDQQRKEAAEARRREEERAARIKAGTQAIDATFDGGKAASGMVGWDTEYDPNQTYYRADGSVWTPPAEMTPPPAPETPAAGTGSTTGSTPKKPNRPGDIMNGMFGWMPNERPEPKPNRQDNPFTMMMAAAANRNKEQPETPWQKALREGLFTSVSEKRGFDDQFFQDRHDAFMGFYQPQLDEQFGDAKDQLTYALARAGTLNSTLAADKQADLMSKYDVQRASLLSQADADVADTKTRLNQEKSALVAQLNATGDADRVSNEALSRTQQLYQQKPNYNALGDVFAGAAAGIGNYFNARNDTQLYNGYFGGTGGPSRGSGRAYYTVGR